MTSPSLHIVWAHRWEHDKNPESLFRVLEELHQSGCRFMVSVLGERSVHAPDVFSEATRQKIGAHIKHWGYVESKEKFWEILRHADVTLSTARFDTMRAHTRTAHAHTRTHTHTHTHRRGGYD